MYQSKIENSTMKTLVILAFITVVTASRVKDERIVPRELDEYATNTMKENGQIRAAAPECKG